MNRTQANVYLAAILETVGDSPDGAPSGLMYAALMGKLSLVYSGRNAGPGMLIHLRCSK